jgi:membrane protein
VKSTVARLRASKPWRAWERYSEARGNILAGGVSYFAFFSIFPAVALAFTVFGFVLHGHPELLQSVTTNLNANLPGFVKDAHHDGLIPIQAPRPAALTITGVIAFVSLVLAGMGWLGAVREGIRAVFGARGALGNLVTTKLRDLGVLFALGLGILVAAVLTIVVGGTADWIAERIGMSGQSWILVLSGLPVSVLVDTALMLLLMRVLSGVPGTWRELSQGALVGGVGFSLMKIFADALLQRLTANPLFASLAIVFGLLIWLNLIARLTLIAAAWAANDVARSHGGELLSPGHAGGDAALPATADSRATPATRRTLTAGPVTQTSGTTRAASRPTFGVRSADRTTLAAGAVLGAFIASAAGMLLRSIRSLVGLGRR